MTFDKRMWWRLIKIRRRLRRTRLLDVAALFDRGGRWSAKQPGRRRHCKIRKSDGGTDSREARWSVGRSGFSRADALCSHGHTGNDALGARIEGCGSPSSSTDNDNFQTLYKTQNTMAAHRTGIADIPVELLIDNILPFCEAKDVVSLGCTNKFFALLTTDDMFWKRKLAVDYNFTGSETARTNGWKFIYQRLRNPRVFVWGCVILSCSFVCYLMHPANYNHQREE